MRFIACLIALSLAASPAMGWGRRAHSLINRAAVLGLPDDGPTFLRGYTDWIAYLSIVPDTWRRPSEGFLKIYEDPNHGWFREQFDFMTEVPRSRYEFVIALYDAHRKLAMTDPEAARLTNVRWTGTLPYAAMEGYERLKAAFRTYHMIQTMEPPESFGKWPNLKHVEMEIAFYMGWLGHYTGDGAQPLHDSIHHDGWQGPNPKNYTRDRSIHGLFESRYVELIDLELDDFTGRIGKPKVLDDPFASIVAHLDKAQNNVERVYQLEQAGALADKDHAEARELVYQQVAAGAELLRDLTYTAWVKREEKTTYSRDPRSNPISPEHPRYNPATGSAPAR